MISPRSLMAASSLIVLNACHPASVPLTPSATWTDPDGRFSISVPGAPQSREVAELSGIGSINFKVYSVDPGDLSIRFAALAYPPGGEGVLHETPSVWAKEELLHSAGKKIARMQGEVRHQDLVADPAGVLCGEETHFEVVAENGERGQGVLRSFITIAPPFVRYEALCLAPAASDFSPCLQVVRSLTPLPAKR